MPLKTKEEQLAANAKIRAAYENIPYVEFQGAGDTVCLDGHFSVEQLVEITDLLRNAS